jgi:hypothetical protein
MSKIPDLAILFFLLVLAISVVGTFLVTRLVGA